MDSLESFMSLNLPTVLQIYKIYSIPKQTAKEAASTTAKWCSWLWHMQSKCVMATLIVLHHLIKER